MESSSLHEEPERGSRQENSLPSLKVLIVEDDLAQARLIRAYLEGASRASFFCAVCNSFAQLEDHPNKEEYDVLLLDLTLPDSQGFETFTKASALCPGLPILVLSGLDDEQVAIRAVREGAQDYLVKSECDDSILFRALLHAVERHKISQMLNRSIREKELMLKEIHHRVKNNLQVICSLLSLQSRQSKEPALIEMLKESRNRIMSMALVHDQLYRSKDFSQIDFSMYLKSLAKTLSDAYSVTKRNILLELRLNSLSVSIDKAIPAGLIMNELLSNALRYGVKGEEGGQVTMSLDEENDQILLRVSDSGEGLPPHISWESPKTLGLELVAALTQQLSGKLLYTHTPQSEFSLRFSKEAPDPHSYMVS